MANEWEVVSHEPIAQNGWEVVSQEPIVTSPNLGSVPPTLGQEQPANNAAVFEGPESYPPWFKQKAAEQLSLLGSMLPGWRAIPGAISGQILHDIAYPPPTPGTFAATPIDQWPQLAKDITSGANPGQPGPPPPGQEQPNNAAVFEGPEHYSPVAGGPSSGEYAGVQPFWQAEFDRLRNAALMGSMAAVAGPVLGAAGRYLSPQLAGEGRAALPQLALKSQPFMEGLLNLFPGSQLMVSRYRNQFNNWALNERNDFIKTYVDALPSNTEAGGKLSGELQNIITAPQKQYQQFAEAGGDLAIPVPKLQEFAQANLEGAKGKTAQWLQKIADSGELTTGDISSLLGGNLYGAKGTLRGPVKDAVMSDLASYDAAAGTQFASIRQSADTLYKNTMQQWKDNPVFNQIVDTSAPSLRLPAKGTRPNFMKMDRPDLVIDKAFGNLNPSTADDLLQIKAAISPEAWNMSLARGLENNLAKAMDGGKLNPDKWASIWNEIGPSVQKIAPEVAPRIQTWTDTILAAKKQLPMGLGESKGARFLNMGIGDLGSALGTKELYEKSGGGAEGSAAVIAANILPVILAHKFLGPIGPQLIKRYASSAIQPMGQAAAAYGVGNYLNRP